MTVESGYSLARVAALLRRAATWRVMRRIIDWCCAEYVVYKQDLADRLPDACNGAVNCDTAGSEMICHTCDRIGNPRPIQDSGRCRLGAKHHHACRTTTWITLSPRRATIGQWRYADVQVR